MKADAVTPSVDLPPDGDGHPSHPEHPAVVPRLTYTITDLWDGRMSEAVRKQWEALLLALSVQSTDEPDEYQGLPKTEYKKIYDGQIDREPPASRAGAPDIQQVIANQIQNSRLEYSEPEPAPIKKPTWGRLMTRGR